MANYTLSGLKIGPNTYTIPTGSAKSYRVQGNVSATPGSFGTTGTSIWNLACLDESGSQANLPDLRSYPTYPIRFQLTDSNSKVWDVYLAKVDVTSSSAYILQFLTDTWYIELTYDSISHTLMSAKAYDIASGSTPAQSDTVMLRVTAGSYPMSSVVPTHATLQQASWANNGNTSAEINDARDCFYNGNGQTKKHLVLELAYKYQNVNKYYPCDVVNTFYDGSNRFGLIMLYESGSTYGQWFKLSGSGGVDFNTNGPSS